LITGLGAVVLATLGNSVIEWLKAHLSDMRGRRISRRILLTDLQLHEQRVKGSLDMVSIVGADAGGTGYSIPVRESFPYLEMVGKDLGLLNEDEVSAVINAYAHLGSELEFLPYLNVTFTRYEGKLSAFVPLNHREELHGLLEATLTPVKEAVAVLKRRTRHGGRATKV
jgi:hypothetical protein